MSKKIHTYISTDCPNMYERVVLNYQFQGFIDWPSILDSWETREVPAEKVIEHFPGYAIVWDWRIK